MDWLTAHIINTTASSGAKFRPTPYADLMRRLAWVQFLGPWWKKPY